METKKKLSELLDQLETNELYHTYDDISLELHHLELLDDVKQINELDKIILETEAVLSNYKQIIVKFGDNTSLISVNKTHNLYILAGQQSNPDMILDEVIMGGNSLNLNDSFDINGVENQAILSVKFKETDNYNNEEYYKNLVGEFLFLNKSDTNLEEYFDADLIEIFGLILGGIGGDVATGEIEVVRVGGGV